MDVERLAVVASTLAAQGICPTTSRKVLEPHVVKTVLSHLYACGMKGVRAKRAPCVPLPLVGNSGLHKKPQDRANLNPHSAPRSMSTSLAVRCVCVEGVGDW
jgi:hypothetical protein